MSTGEEQAYPPNEPEMGLSLLHNELLARREDALAYRDELGGELLTTEEQREAWYKYCHQLFYRSTFAQQMVEASVSSGNSEVTTSLRGLCLNYCSVTITYLADLEGNTQQQTDLSVVILPYDKNIESWSSTPLVVPILSITDIHRALPDHPFLPNQLSFQAVVDSVAEVEDLEEFDTEEFLEHLLLGHREVCQYLGRACSLLVSQAAEYYPVTVPGTNWIQSVDRHVNKFMDVFVKELVLVDGAQTAAETKLGVVARDLSSEHDQSTFVIPLDDIQYGLTHEDQTRPIDVVGIEAARYIDAFQEVIDHDGGRDGLEHVLYQLNLHSALRGKELTIRLSGDGTVFAGQDIEKDDEVLSDETSLVYNLGEWFELTGTVVAYVANFEGDTSEGDDDSEEIIPDTSNLYVVIEPDTEKPYHEMFDLDNVSRIAIPVESIRSSVLAGRSLN